MVTKQRKIKVSVANLRNLAQLHGCTETAVYNALSYRSNSANAESIRQSALGSYGGREVTELVMR